MVETKAPQPAFRRPLAARNWSRDLPEILLDRTFNRKSHKIPEKMFFILFCFCSTLNSPQKILLNFGDFLFLHLSKNLLNLLQT